MPEIHYKLPIGTNAINFPQMVKVMQKFNDEKIDNIFTIHKYCYAVCCLMHYDSVLC